eukprot:4856173-Pleurochrysis_carterae.AAC.1
MISLFRGQSATQCLSKIFRNIIALYPEMHHNMARCTHRAGCVGYWMLVVVHDLFVLAKCRLARRCWLVRGVAAALCECTRSPDAPATAATAARGVGNQRSSLGDRQ